MSALQNCVSTAIIPKKNVFTLKSIFPDNLKKAIPVSFVGTNLLEHKMFLKGFETNCRFPVNLKFTVRSSGNAHYAVHFQNNISL